MLKQGASLREIGDLFAPPESKHNDKLCESRLSCTPHAGFALAGRCAMSRLQKAVQDYIDMRRALGFKLTEAAVGLRDFISFLKRRSASHITIPLALEWSQQNPAVQPSQWAQRLTWVRCFVRYCSDTDGRTQILSWGLLPHRLRRARPYLYTEEAILH